MNLEGCDLGTVGTKLVPDTVDVVTMDLSYLAVADAAPQLERLDISTDADLVALVKPTFELHRRTLAASNDDVTDALRRATAAIQAAGWEVLGTCPAPPTGQRGAREALVYAHHRPRNSARFE